MPEPRRWRRRCRQRHHLGVNIYNVCQSKAGFDDHVYTRSIDDLQPGRIIGQGKGDYMLDRTDDEE